MRADDVSAGEAPRPDGGAADDGCQFLHASLFHAHYHLIVIGIYDGIEADDHRTEQMSDVWSIHVGLTTTNAQQVRSVGVVDHADALTSTQMHG
jgi:hypothetical protein